MELSISGNSSPSKDTDLRGTWPQALLSLVGSVTLILGIRWAFFEPYVIPSGSMIPTLLVHDHILVNKLAYGVRFPFTSSWILHFGPPKRGDVVVFKSVEDSGVFIVKRVIGLPGDEIRVEGRGQLIINGKPVERRRLDRAEAESQLIDWSPAQDFRIVFGFFMNSAKNFGVFLRTTTNGEAAVRSELRDEFLGRYDFFEENLDGRRHLALIAKDSTEREQGPYKVGPDEIFMMGDNRDNSSDSRVWGALPLDRILGRASGIWLSCDETLPDASQLCDPRTMRWMRITKGIL